MLLLYNHTEVNKGTPPRAYQCAKPNAYTLNSKHEHTCRQPDSEALRARAQRQWNGSGCHELALGSSEGQARFAGRTASKLALAIAGAMRMRLAELTSLAVPSYPGAVRMRTSLACLALRASWLGGGAFEAPTFANLLRLTSEQLRARISGVAAEGGPIAFATWL